MDYLILSSVLWLLLSGCQNFHVVRALSPRVNPPGPSPVVDTLQPTLRWESSNDPGAKYDLIIYKAGPRHGFYHNIGEVVYYREALLGTEHKVEAPLSENTIY